MACDKWNILLQEFKFIGVRGPLSQKLLHDQGIRRAEVIGDPVLYFAKPVVSTKQFRKNIGICVGTANGKLWGGDEESLIRAVSGLCRIMLQRGFHLTFVPVWPKDLPYIVEAVKQIGFGKHISVFEHWRDHAATFDLLESFDLFIGQKLHSVVMAVCVNTPVIMLEYRPKCLDFMESMDLQTFNYRVDQISTEEILSSIDYIYDNMEMLQKKIMTKAVSYKNRLTAAAETIASNVRAAEGL